MVQIDQILAGMNLKEKIAFCTGADFWHTKGASGIFMCRR